MVLARRVLLDTNILLRVFKKEDADHRLVKTALKDLETFGFETCFALQNIAEFWNVCTRPVDRNGFGLTISEAVRCVEFFEGSMTLIADTADSYSIWRKLITSHQVRGVQVHDAGLAALMIAHGIPSILTLNRPDFVRYAELLAIHPSQIQSLTQ